MREGLLSSDELIFSIKELKIATEQASIRNTAIALYHYGVYTEAQMIDVLKNTGFEIGED